MVHPNLRGAPDPSVGVLRSDGNFDALDPCPLTEPISRASLRINRAHRRAHIQATAKFSVKYCNNDNDKRKMKKIAEDDRISEGELDLSSMRSPGLLCFTEKLAYLKLAVRICAHPRASKSKKCIFPRAPEGLPDRSPTGTRLENTKMQRKWH